MSGNGEIISLSWDRDLQSIEAIKSVSEKDDDEDEVEENSGDKEKRAAVVEEGEDQEEEEEAAGLSAVGMLRPAHNLLEASSRSRSEAEEEEDKDEPHDRERAEDAFEDWRCWKPTKRSSSSSGGEDSEKAEVAGRGKDSNSLSNRRNSRSLPRRCKMTKKKTKEERTTSEITPTVTRKEREKAKTGSVALGEELVREERGVDSKILAEGLMMENK